MPPKLCRSIKNAIGTFAHDADERRLGQERKNEAHLERLEEKKNSNSSQGPSFLAPLLPSPSPSLAHHSRNKRHKPFEIISFQEEAPKSLLSYPKLGQIFKIRILSRMLCSLCYPSGGDESRLCTQWCAEVAEQRAPKAPRPQSSRLHSKGLCLLPGGTPEMLCTI